jgi:hypothetical protein
MTFSRHKGPCLTVSLHGRSIITVIEKILNEDWNDGDGRKEDPPTNSTDLSAHGRDVKKKSKAVPVPEGDDPDDPCVDCYKCTS